MTRIVIVGGGASGALLATHLLRNAASPHRADIIEWRDELGAGIAYATHHPDHLLNVRAANMSAFPDDPGHFARWLDDRPGEMGGTGPEAFVPRRLYRDYLASLLDPLIRDGRLRRVRGEAVSLVDRTGGAEVRLDDGRLIHGDAAVLATGNEGPALPPEPWRYDGWGDLGACRIDPAAHVVVIGTGLTMVDRVLWLLHDGHRGTITAVSRHGLMPQAHRPGLTPIDVPATNVPVGAPLVELLRWLRKRTAEAEAAGLDWRTVFDGLRPHTQALWTSLREAERRRFLRHGQAFWSVHRHRIAPRAAERLAGAEASGQLRTVTGRVTDFRAAPHGVTVMVQARGGRPTQLEAAAVFECRGRAGDVGRTENPVLRSVLSNGSARPDALGLGLAVTSHNALVRADGSTSDRLYAMGPVTAGTFWEITAIPDIRAQASQLAAHLTKRATAA